MIATEPPARELRRAAVGSVGWQGVSYVSGKVLVLATTIILARLLTPKEFGVVALALIFITYADVLTDLGAAEALVYFPADQRLNDVALVISLLWSITLTLLALLVAPQVAAFFHAGARAGEVTALFRLLALSLLFGGTAEVPDALLRKELQFRRRVVADLGRTLGQGVTSIILAVLLHNAWAIAWGYVAGDVLWSVIAWTLVSYRPSRRLWRLDWVIIRRLLGFGIPAVGSAFLLVLVFNVDYLIVGRRLGATPLGFYTLAFRIPQTVIIYVFYVLSTVAYPLFSKARIDEDRLRRGYLASIRLQSTYGMAAGVGIAMIAPMLVAVVFGPKWSASVVPLEGIALYAAFRALGTGAGDVYKGIGRPRLSLWLALLRLSLLAPALWLAASPRYGISWVAWTQVVVAFVMAILMQVVASRILGLRPRTLARAFRPAVVIGAGVALGSGLVRTLAPLPTADWRKLALAVTCGAIVGLGGLFALERDFLRETRSLIRPRSAQRS